MRTAGAVFSPPKRNLFESVNPNVTFGFDPRLVPPVTFREFPRLRPTVTFGVVPRSRIPSVTLGVVTRSRIPSATLGVVPRLSPSVTLGVTPRVMPPNAPLLLSRSIPVFVVLPVFSFRLFKSKLLPDFVPRPDNLSLSVTMGSARLRRSGTVR